MWDMFANKKGMRFKLSHHFPPNIAKFRIRERHLARGFKRGVLRTGAEGLGRVFVGCVCGRERERRGREGGFGHGGFLRSIGR